MKVLSATPSVDAERWGTFESVAKADPLVWDSGCPGDAQVMQGDGQVMAGDFVG